MQYWRRGRKQQTSNTYRLCLLWMQLANYAAEGLFKSWVKIRRFSCPLWLIHIELVFIDIKMWQSIQQLQLHFIITKPRTLGSAVKNSNDTQSLLKDFNLFWTCFCTDRKLSCLFYFILFSISFCQRRITNGSKTTVHIDLHLWDKVIWNSCFFPLNLKYFLCTFWRKSYFISSDLFQTFSGF